MKKISLSIAALALVFAVTFTSCKKDDTGLPVVSLTGDGTIAIDLGTTWTDPGATATDENDGTITPVVTGTVNIDKVGEYTITYTATDAAGNVGTAKRTVQVKADKLAKAYEVVETYSDGASSYTYNQTVAVSSTFDKLTFTSLGGYVAANVSATASATGITAAEKTFQAPSTSPTSNCRIYNFTGTYGKVGTAYNVLTVTYKLDSTPIAGGTTETVTISQTYTVIN